MRPRWRNLYVWHRYTGVTAAAFALTLAVTGLLLNLTDRLGLAERTVAYEWLLDWYGIPTPQATAAYDLDSLWLSQFGERLFIDERPVPGVYPPLRGAVRLPDALLAVFPDRMALLTPQGEVIDVWGDEQGIPAAIERAGRAGETVVVGARDGTYRAEPDLMRWTELNGVAVSWVSARELPEPIQRRAVAAYRAQSLTWERVLLDLHSGRLFGRWGEYLVDVAAAGFVLLAMSGFWLWLRQPRR